MNKLMIKMMLLGGSLAVVLPSAAQSLEPTTASNVASTEKHVINDSTQQSLIRSASTQAATDEGVVSSQERVTQLSYVAQDMKAAPEARIDALHQLGNLPNQNALVAVARGLKDDNDLIRQAAIVGARPYSFEYRWRLVSPLLEDKNEMVRMVAMTNLVRDYSTMTLGQQKQVKQPIDDLIQYLTTKEGAPSKQLLADVYRWSQQHQQAEERYVELFNTGLNDADLWLSYADNFRAQGDNQRAVIILDEAIRSHPDNAELHYSKSLALVRVGEQKFAAMEIETAAQLASNNSYYWYLNGVIQESVDLTKSISAFEQAYKISGAPEQLYAVCDIYARYDNPKYPQCIDELEKVAPDYVIQELNSKYES